MPSWQSDLLGNPGDLLGNRRFKGWLFKQKCWCCKLWLACSFWLSALLAFRVGEARQDETRASVCSWTMRTSDQSILLELGETFNYLSVMKSQMWWMKKHSNLNNQAVMMSQGTAKRVVVATCEHTDTKERRIKSIQTRTADKESWTVHASWFILESFCMSSTCELTSSHNTRLCITSDTRAFLSRIACLSFGVTFRGVLGCCATLNSY